MKRFLKRLIYGRWYSKQNDRWFQDFLWQKYNAREYQESLAFKAHKEFASVSDEKRYLERECDNNCSTCDHYIFNISTHHYICSKKHDTPLKQLRTYLARVIMDETHMSWPDAVASAGEVGASEFLSSIEGAKDYNELYERITEYVKREFADWNPANPEAILTFDSNVSEEELNRIRERLKEQRDVTCGGFLLPANYAEVKRRG